MSFAIIETGGKQYRISEGELFRTEKLAENPEVGSTVTFDKVLLMSDGSDVKIGTPYLDGITIEATLEEEGREKKIDVMRFRPKSRHFRKYGHRQPYQTFKISEVGKGGKSSGTAKKADENTAKKTTSSARGTKAHEKTEQKPEDIGVTESTSKAPKKEKSISTPKSRNTNKVSDNTMKKNETKNS